MFVNIRDFAVAAIGEALMARPRNTSPRHGRVSPRRGDIGMPTSSVSRNGLIVYIVVGVVIERLRDDIPDDCQGVVGIHDGVRPFVSAQVIDRCYDRARQCGAAIPVLPVTDTLRQIDSDGSGHNVQRSGYRIVQTPQVFDLQLLKRAFRQPYRDQFTDDASVVEALGSSVEMVEGNRENIKLTTPFDLKVAETLC